jgi:hypothetical protein
VHIGIRGPLYDRADLDDDAGFGFRTIRASDVDVMGVGAGHVSARTSGVDGLFHGEAYACTDSRGNGNPRLGRVYDVA